MEKVNLIEAVKVAQNDPRWVSQSETWVWICLIPAIMAQNPDLGYRQITDWLADNAGQVREAVIAVEVY